MVQTAADDPVSMAEVYQDIAEVRGDLNVLSKKVDLLAARVERLENKMDRVERKIDGLVDDMALVKKVIIAKWGDDSADG